MKSKADTKPAHKQCGEKTAHPSSSKEQIRAVPTKAEGTPMFSPNPDAPELTPEKYAEIFEKMIGVVTPIIQGAIDG